MKYVIILAILLFNIQLGMSQSFAVVKDLDGYANIRNEKGIVVDKLLTNKPVFIFDSDGEWVTIDYSRGGIGEGGSIHKSRLVELSEYEKIPILKETDKSVLLTNGSIKIGIEKENFIAKNYYLTYNQDGNLIQINSNNIWGADGNVPREQYKSITISIGLQQIFFPKSAFEDLFSPNLSSVEAFYDKDENRLYLSSLNGDGAGGYLVLWIFKNGVYEDRLVTHGF